MSDEPKKPHIEEDTLSQAEREPSTNELKNDTSKKRPLTDDEKPEKPVPIRHSVIPQPQPRPADTTKKQSSAPKVAAAAFLCFVASFLGAWAFIASGLVPADDMRTITENRETIVLQEGEVVADVAEAVSPSVVSIVTESRAAQGDANPFAPSIRQGAGTGIIISSDGYVLTNKHVIPEGTTSVELVTSEGETYEDVRVVGRDPLNDIAFLKISGVDDLPAATLGDSSEMKVGQKVIAIGNALGQYETTVTSGIISGSGRPLTATDGIEVEQLENLFQTDTAINPGNSGGPLLNLQGEVIGINTAIAEGAEGIGFAIPINDAKGLIKSVLEEGRVERSFLGVRYVTLTPDIVRELDLDREDGAYINDNGVVANSPADRAGLQDGDIIIKVNDVNVNDDNPLASQLSQFTAGETVQLTYVRDGAEETVDVTLDIFRN